MEPTDQNNRETREGAQPDEPVAKTTAPAAGAGKGEPPKASPKPVVSERKGGRGLGLLALLVALVALGLSAWHWYQTQAFMDGQVAVDAQLERLAELQQHNEQVLASRLEGLPQAADWQRSERLLADLQRSQQALSQRLEALQGDARADWKLAEAEFLLRLASLRLLATQDVASARELLTAVDAILQSQPDSGVFAVREQLAGYQAQLDALPVLDRPGLFLRLSALRDQVSRLVALPVPVFDPDEVSVEDEYEDRLARRDRWERVLMRLERYVRVDFQRGKVITPLLDEAEMQRVQRTLQLTLEQAQWAALRGESQVYRNSLERADAILQQFFELDNPQVRAMQGQLAGLIEMPVGIEPPDLAPLQQGLAAYIQSRRSLPAGNAEAD
ncbi:heme biosynthesis operon protein HemX [Pseudomonas sp. WN033]|nr:heme biosynthesis operon protein HemX [Pseudomonas sp. WN033]